MGNRTAGLVSRASWGVFFIGVGVIWLTEELHELDVWALVVILAGCILVGQNVIRAGLKVKISAGTLGLGFVLLLIGGAMLQEIKLNWLGLLLLLIGLWVLLDLFAKRR